MRSTIRRLRVVQILLIPLLLVCSVGTIRSQTTQTQEPQAGAPIRLRQAQSVPMAASAPPIANPAIAPQPTPPGEFERYVQRQADAIASRVPRQNTDGQRQGEDTRNTDGNSVPVDGYRIRRLGSDLAIRADDFVDTNPLVPPDYTIKAGDELVVTLWGSIDAEVRAVVDRSGRIVIPRVGPVFVSGIPYAELNDTITRRVAQVFRNFELTASLGQLRAQRVFVTGYVPRPGAYTVSSLTTVATALLKAGGPSPSGSFRNIQLRRGEKIVSTFDLYDLLLGGNRGADRVLQPDDVVLVGPVGPQVALIGSVNQPAIFELRSGESVADLLRMAGGFSALADRSRLTMERLDDRATVRVRELAMPQDASITLAHGDVLRAFSAVEAALPAERQNKRVRIEGEVLKPGDYVLPPQSSLSDALRAAGGLTPAA